MHILNIWILYFWLFLFYKLFLLFNIESVELINLLYLIITLFIYIKFVEWRPITAHCIDFLSNLRIRYTELTNLFQIIWTIEINFNIIIKSNFPRLQHFYIQIIIFNINFIFYNFCFNFNFKQKYLIISFD